MKSAKHREPYQIREWTEATLVVVKLVLDATATR